MNRLKELREEKHLSLRELGEKVGITYTAIGLAERGKRGLNNQDIEIFTNFFDVSADYLLGLSDIRKPTPPIKDQLSGTQLALYNGTKDLTDSQMNEILNFVDYVKNKK